MTSVCLAEEKKPLIHAAFGPQISADLRNNVSANQRFLLRVKAAQRKLHHYRWAGNRARLWLVNSEPRSTRSNRPGSTYRTADRSDGRSCVRGESG